VKGKYLTFLPMFYISQDLKVTVKENKRDINNKKICDQKVF